MYCGAPYPTGGALSPVVGAAPKPERGLDIFIDGSMVDGDTPIERGALPGWRAGNDDSPWAASPLDKGCGGGALKTDPP